MSSNEAPNWKKGDIVCLINHNNNVIHIFEAEHDPYYGKTLFSSTDDWHYGLRNCKELRLANQEDIDKKIKYQTDGSFWIRESDATGMLAQNGSWVFSDADGFPARKVQWTLDTQKM